MRRLAFSILAVAALLLSTSALAEARSKTPVFHHQHVCRRFHGLIPLYEAAQTKFNVPWTAIASINFIYDDFGCRKLKSGAPFLPMTPKEFALYGVSGNGSAVVTLQNPADAIDSVTFMLSQNSGQTSLLPAFQYYYREARRAGLALAVNNEIAKQCGYEAPRVSKGPLLPPGVSLEGALNPPKPPVDRYC